MPGLFSLDRNELSFTDYQAATFRPGFDGLRGIGFLLVVTAHIPAMPWFSYLQGWTAVWLFFAISGYLVTMLLIREERKTGAIAYGEFLTRRFFRIVPGYAAAILIYWVALYSLPPLADEYQLFMARLPYYLTLMPEYAHTDVFTIFVHSWIIGVEAKFYVFFPAVFLMIRHDTWRFAVTAATTALLTAQGSFTANAYCAILSGVMLAQLLEWPRSFAAIAMLTRSLHLRSVSLSGPTVLWGLSAPRAGHPSRVHGIRQRHGHQRPPDNVLYARSDDPGSGIAVPDS